MSIYSPCDYITNFEHLKNTCEDHGYRWDSANGEFVSLESEELYEDQFDSLLELP